MPGHSDDRVQVDVVLEGAGRDVRVVPDEREREVIDRAVRALVDEGLSTGQTAALLNGLGLVKRNGPALEPRAATPAVRDAPAGR